MFLLCLFLFAINFMLAGVYFLLIPFAETILLRKKVNITLDMFLLLFFSLWYVICEQVVKQQMSLSVLMIPVAYYVGLHYTDKPDISDAVKFYQVLAWGMCAHLLLNFVAEILSHGGLYFGAIHFDVWSGSYSAVTGQMLNLTMFLPLVSYMVISNKQLIPGILAFLVSVVYGVIAGSRSILILIAVNFVISAVVYVVAEKDNKLKILLSGFAWIATILLLINLAYHFNWLNLRHIWDSSYLAQRFAYSQSQGEGIFYTERWNIKDTYFDLIRTRPWGGANISGSIGVYAHDLWLDTWDQAGMIPMLLIIVYTVRMSVRFIKVASRTENVAAKVLFISYTVVFILQLFAEPILQGAPVFFISTCVLDGIATKLLTAREKL